MICTGQPNITRVIKSRRMRWAGHVARMGDGRGAERVLVGRTEGKRALGRPVHRWEDNIKMDRLKKSKKMQQYADIYLLLNYATCFVRPSRPSSGVHETVVAAYGADHTIWGASFLKRDQIRTDLIKFEEACSPDSMICTRGCNYSFM